MSIEERLKELILSKYKSVREFSQYINMPYSTLDSVLKRGVNKAGINSLISICKELNLDINKLAEGDLCYKLESKVVNKVGVVEDSFTKEEIELIRNYRELDLEDKAILRGEARGMLLNSKYNKKPQRLSC